MAKFTIHSKDGRNARHVGEPQYSGSYMSVDYVEFRSISSPSIIDWEIGDYIDYFRTGKRYKLYSIPMPKKVARVGSYGAAIEYSNVQFFAATKELEIAPFKDLVADDNGIHFSTRPDVSTFEDVHGIARRIEACMNDIFPNRWKINVYESDDEDLNARISEAKEFSVSQGSCLDALSQIYDTWKGVGWIHTTENGQEVVTIGRANVRDTGNTTGLFTHGIGNGLTSIKKAAANEGEFATRLYVYGANRNLPPRYYNQFDIVNKDSADIQNLMIPIGEWGLTDGIPDPSKAYLQADDALIEKYGLIPKTVYFDGSQHEEIYPSIRGLKMSEVRDAMIEAGQGDSEYLPALPVGGGDFRIDEVGLVNNNDYDDGTREDYEKSPNIDIRLREMGFNLAEQGKLTSEGYAVISMVSGDCQGREFRVRKYVGPAYGDPIYGRRVYNIEKAWDESLGMAFPNKIYKIRTGDQFVLLDIPMPDFYVTINSDKLLERGKQMLADYTRVSAFYEPGVNAIRMKEVGGVITPGMFMQISDNDIIDTEDHKDYVLIDSISIDEHSDIPTYKITLREQKRSSRTFSVLEEMIEDAKEDTNQAIKRERQYTERRFRSAQETLKMLESAFGNFSKGITPVTVQTMSMLIGDESLQYKFTKSRESLVDVPCPLSWSAETKQMIGVPASLLHMTLDITGVVPAGTRGASDYKSWNIVSWWDKGTFESPFLEDGEKSYYVYVKASKYSADAWFYMDENSHSMIEDDAYYFMVGILNSEYDGNRDFVTLYGYTEVLPGQITTDIIRSSDGKTYFDLVNGVISGDIKFIAKGGEEKDMADFADEQKAEFSKVDKNVQNLQDQIDGVVENHFYEGIPTTSNYPASEWVTDEQKINHIGDTYTDIEEFVDSQTTPNAGKSWRWCRCDDMVGITDYVEVTDKDGVTYKLHWHPIADTDAVKALLKTYELEKRVSDAEYLKDTFKKGSTEIAGGVVMSQMVAVRNSEEEGGEIEAFLNGSDFAEDDDKGKLILACGVPKPNEISGYIDLEPRAKKAKTRIYENGRIETSEANITGNISAKNGNFGCLECGKDSVSVDYQTPYMRNFASIRSNYGLAFHSHDTRDETTINCSFGHATVKSNTTVSDLEGNVIKQTPNIQYRQGLCVEVDTSPEKYNYPTISGIYVSVTGAPVNYAIKCPNGMFAGLRPKTRVVTQTNVDTVLTELDHTVIVNYWPSGRVYISLPESPREGQEYEIYSSNAECQLSINSAGITIYVINEGIERVNEDFSSQNRRYIKLVYAKGLWWETYWQF